MWPAIGLALMTLGGVILLVVLAGIEDADARTSGRSITIGLAIGLLMILAGMCLLPLC